MEHRQILKDGDTVIGKALWRHPWAETGEALLCIDACRDTETFYRAALACADEARAEGVRSAQFVIRNPKLLRQLQRHFRVDPKPCGWEPNTGKAVQWMITVDIEDAIQQLHGRLG